MGFLTPVLPEYEVDDWIQRPYRERIRLLRQSWAVQGFGVPSASYAFYFIKIVLHVGGWALFVTLTPGIGGLSSIGSWWATTIAFEKAVLWTILFEVSEVAPADR